MSNRLSEWTYTRTLVARDETEARTLGVNEAQRNVPGATFEVVAVRRTPTGRYSVKVKATR